MKTASYKLGFLGAMGCFGLWLGATYLIFHLLGLELESADYSRGYRSRHSYEIRSLSWVKFTWENLCKSERETVVQQRYLNLSPQELEKLLRPYPEGLEMLNLRYGVTQNLKLQLSTWLETGYLTFPLMDMYGFPAVPAGSEQLMIEFFPRIYQFPGNNWYSSVFEEPPLRLGNSGISFPAWYRINQLGEKIQKLKCRNQTILTAYWLLTLTGLILSIKLGFFSLFRRRLTRILQISGILTFFSGLLSLFYFQMVRTNFVMCYMRVYPPPDPARISTVEIAEIKSGFHDYLKALKSEGAITEQQRQQLEELIKLR